MFIWENKERFICFLEEQLVHVQNTIPLGLLTILQAPQLTPYPGPQNVVVLDNCVIHHDEEICCIIVEDCGGFLLYH